MQRKRKAGSADRMLYDIADDAEAPANSRLSAIRKSSTDGRQRHAGRRADRGAASGDRVSDRRRYEFPVTGGRQRSCSRTRETLFGGAAGGGKSHGQLLDALRFAVCYPGSRQLMLRHHAGLGSLYGGFAAVSAALQSTGGAPVGFANGSLNSGTVTRKTT
ncbi:MAG: hypothetical protein ACLSDM_06175 [Butyricicoccus sp.]